jgi:hypothetical protein
MNKRELLANNGLEGAIVFDCPEFDDAIIGTSHDDRVVYSYSKMIDCLMERDGMDYEMACEFIDYNTIRALPYVENGPIVVYDLGE